jgi:hypothetical protein
MPHFPRLLHATLCLLLFASCVGTGPSPDPHSSYNGPVSLVALISRPLSWEKLEGLEQWLDRNSSNASSTDVLNARLELADGRSTFARSDQNQTSAAVLKMRRERAISDYRIVLASTSASSSQRARAQNGIALVGGSYTGSPNYQTSTPGGGTTLTIIPRAQWGAAREVPDHMSRHQAPWSDIIVHHTAMKVGSDTSQAGRSAELRVIQRSHLGKRDPQWGDIGYHYLIDPEGRIYEGRRLAWRGAHVAGLNDHKIGVCLLGNFDLTTPTTASLATLERLLDDLRTRNQIPRARVSYHTAIATNATQCPGRNLISWMQNYRSGNQSVANIATAPKPTWSRAGTVR